MSDVAVRVEGLSKRYRLGQYVGYKTLRESLFVLYHTPTRVLGQTVRRLRQPSHGGAGLEPADEGSHIWALKDVSFEVRQGEALGIIGRNGSGKSTILKILSRITAPTEGCAEIRGRVGSLLEVGTGFHPELTGRENVYLNGAILGMKRADVARKFDEIVAFAETEKFLDTPVKRYSSGMYVRLAFAVAAHLEPDILIVDEVLAVGDTAFQKKCLGKMTDVAHEGRTVLFVTHNLSSLANLCPRALLLESGVKRTEGPTNEVVRRYLSTFQESPGEIVWSDPQTAPGNENVRLRAIRILSGGRASSIVDIEKDAHVHIEFWNLKEGARLCTSIHLMDQMGNPVLASNNMHSVNLTRDDWFGKLFPKGLYRAVCTLPGNFLNEGTYTVVPHVMSDLVVLEATAPSGLSFDVHDTGGMRKEYSGPWVGVVRPRLAWQTEHLGSLSAAGERE